MPFEVELKFPVRDPSAVIERVQAEGAVYEATQQQCDVYYNHPSRNFAETDEALRIRTLNGQHRITYKGPLVDETTKTRREIEIPIGESVEDGTRFTELLSALGFREVRTVRKSRRLYRMMWKTRSVEFCVDDVDELGTFVELETIADEADLNAARDSLRRLAAKLGLENSERRSYLRLLLEQDGLMQI